jgi:pyridoxal biosynthesis lyase PdxS|tara:strand:- start:5674 stop:6000 length:327 start_codon:yes stop_codon:yes gene_type:complete
MNEKDGFKIKVESSKNRAFGGDTGIDTKDEQGVSDALLDAVEHQRQVNEKQNTINEMLIDSVESLINADVESVVNVKDTNYTRYYDKELGIWFCKFCEQQIVGDQNGI